MQKRNIVQKIFNMVAAAAKIRTQVEKSEARQFLQPAQYCASCDRGVMPMLLVNTEPNIGILLAYY